jgi:hypothetical protein
MIRALPLLATLIAVPVSAEESSQIISADEWARPRSGESLVEMPALADTVRDYLASNDRRISIRHPQGEEGVLWAEELRSWLVALGVPSADIVLSPESTRIDAIELAVTEGNE